MGNTLTAQRESETESTPISDPSGHIYRETLSTVASLVETRDPSTGDHLGRIRSYCEFILRELSAVRIGGRPISNSFTSLVVQASTLHDIGKAAIPDSLLLKRGRLNANELREMRGHTVAGFQAIARLIDRVGPHPYLVVARDIAHFHHERWDGSGYPTGRSGNDIPLAARVVAVADVFDALVSRRCYKAPMPIWKAKSMIERGAGTHFDPQVVKAFSRAANLIAGVVKRTMPSEE